MSTANYVIITPARNAEATIQTTIESVICQTILPKEWVIVSDGSTDHTDEIIRCYAAQHAFLRLVRLDHRHPPSFASVVFATEAGCKALQSTDYDYIGLLDADVRFPANYYERLVRKFIENPRLGLTGGLVWDVADGSPRKTYQALHEVAGATQFFRRECFESLGGLFAIPEGGWDAITCVRARMNGFTTRTFPDLLVDHLKPRDAAFGHPLRGKWQRGIRDYALASHPVFELAKCCSRCLESPPLVGSLARLLGYGWAALTWRKRILPTEVVDYVRREQLQRLNRFTYGRTIARLPY